MKPHRYRYRLDDINAWWHRCCHTLEEVAEAADKRIKQTDGDCVLVLYTKSHKAYLSFRCLGLSNQIIDYL